MRRLFLCFSACLMGFVGLPATAKGLRVGDTAPLIEAKTTKGEAFSLDAYKGRTLVLEWTDPACRFVAKHYDTGNMQKLQQYAGNNDIVWISVEAPGVTVKPADLNAAAEVQLATPKAILTDPEGKLAAAYAVRATPEIFIVRGGKIAYIGAVDSIMTSDPLDVDKAEPFVYSALKQIANGEAVEFTTSKAYGCPLMLPKGQ